MVHSLRWRMVVSYVALVLVSMAGLSLLLYILVRNTYMDSLRGNLEANATLLAKQVEPLIPGGALQPEMDALVRQFANTLDTRITVISPTGQVLAESSFDPARMENHLSRAEVQQALAGQPASNERFSETLEIEMLYLAVPVETGGEVTGVVRMAYSLENIQGNLAVTRGTMLAISLLASALAILLSFALGSYAIRPLHRLTRSIQQMNGEDNIEPGYANRLDEVGQLGYAFNHLTTRLNSQIDALVSEREKLSAVLGHMNDGVVIADVNGMVQMINPAAQQLFGLAEDQALDHSLVEVVRHHQLVDLWRKSQSTARQQVTTLETSPDRLFIQAIATPLTRSMPGSTLLVFQDLTRLRRLEMVRSDFISNVSHELRTPLASLKALTETLMEGALEDLPAARRFLVRMENEIDNLTQIVQELLELSRIESGKVPLEKRPVSPYEMITAAAERMQLQAERAGIQLRLDIPQEMPNVSADSLRIEQVLVNLLHNAIKFTEPGGTITIGAYEQPAKIIFYVRDTGVGIDPESLPRIFERFYKADRARSGGGTGLGLSISRHLVEGHGGRIWAESAPRQGSRFSFSLPVAE